MSLMYNTATDNLVTRAQLQEIPTPAPRGAYHQPVPFFDYVELVDTHLKNNGIQLLKEEYCVSKDNEKFFGMAELKPLEGELITAKDWALTLGLRGSHDMSIPRGLTLGTSVMVCSNLCFHGDLGTFTTKQTINIWERLPQLVREAVSRIPQLAQEQQHTFDSLKNFQLQPRHGDAALVEIHRRGGFTSAELGVAIKEWDRPTYEEHSQDGYTAWRLLNASTQAIKPRGERVNMELVRQRTMIASDFINSFAKAA